MNTFNKTTKTIKSKETGASAKAPEGASNSTKGTASVTSPTSTPIATEAKPSSTSGAYKSQTGNLAKLNKQLLRQPKVGRQAGVTATPVSDNSSSQVQKWPTIKISDPSKVGYQERRNAARLLTRVHSTPPTGVELTKELQEAIDWAKVILPNFQIERPVRSETTKRQRSAEGDSSQAKKIKTHSVMPHKSFAEVAKNRIIIGVVDSNDPEGRIPKSQWKWVNAALTKVAMEILTSNPGPPPSCTDAGWYQGQIKIVACDDERSVQLYKIAISKVGEVYPGAKLAVVEKKDIPSRPRARVWIPNTPSDPVEIMQLLRACNPNLPTDKWKFVKSFEDTPTTEVESKRATMQIMLLLTEDSLEPLAKSDGEVNYGFCKVKIMTYRSDTLGQLADDDDSSSEMDLEEKESIGDVESIGHASSGTDLTEGIANLMSEKELLGEEYADTNYAPPSDQSASQ